MRFNCLPHRKMNGFQITLFTILISLIGCHCQDDGGINDIQYMESDENFGDRRDISDTDNDFSDNRDRSDFDNGFTNSRDRSDNDDRFTNSRDRSDYDDRSDDNSNSGYDRSDNGGGDRGGRGGSNTQCEDTGLLCKQFSWACNHALVLSKCFKTCGVC